MSTTVKAANRKITSSNICGVSVRQFARGEITHETSYTLIYMRASMTLKVAAPLAGHEEKNAEYRQGHGFSPQH